MKFGKYIQAQQIPGWSSYYLDYKTLKKIISSLVANRPVSEAAASSFGFPPPEVSGSREPHGSSVILEESPGQPPIFSASGQDDSRGPNFQAHKAYFFFRLERELEKINGFYLQKEAELTLRMETLLSKRRAAVLRGLPDASEGTTQTHVEWSAVEEGFRLLERDLGKLQQFVEVNATGFRKILKKYDKRSTSTTKELYLARQVDVQPVFNRQLISELSDTVAACLLNITDLSSGLKFEGPAANDIVTQQIMTERVASSSLFRDLENSFHKAITTSDTHAIIDCVNYSDILAQQKGGKTNVTRILWNVIIEAPPDLSDLILSLLSSPFDYHFVDDINGRTCLHEAAIAGSERLVDLCIKNGVAADRCDVYGRTALHYGCMNGHKGVCKQLVEAGVPTDTLDRDSYSPLVYATLEGNVDCVRVLLEQGNVSVLPSTPSRDLIPLSLACQSGHVDIVLLLLQKGAKCVSNSSGEYPMHLAAREGHVEVCKVLLHLEGWDTPDKYNEWTPLFHAARYGRAECIEVLLSAGSRVQFRDELGHFAAHYAAWFGHRHCLSILLEAMKNAPLTANLMNTREISPMSDTNTAGESEIDLIPSLSLPPPIMPHRVYGHNYLNKSHLIQISIGRSARGFTTQPGVRLHHRLINPGFKDEYLLASTPLKLVMTTSSHINPAPYCISLPQKDENGIFAFQIPSLDRLTLEFSVYPSFGTKTIGRAVAFPSLFSAVEGSQQFTLPILDNRLHVIGEVDFELNIITSFQGITLESGGAFETYWKSTAVTTPLAQLSFSPKYQQGPNSGSAQASPSTHYISNAGGQASTISSLQGRHIYVVVQVTRDFQPVVFADWLLPDTTFDLGVADVTLAQFEALSDQLRRNLTSSMPDPDKLPGFISTTMLSLEKLLKILPLDVNLCLELAYPSRLGKVQLPFGRYLNLNSFVDSVLQTIYNVSPLRRKIVFSSFSPDVCSALNWKQPNYPVFFAVHCGNSDSCLPSRTALGSGCDDIRALSINSAVEFAKLNNLLGILVDAELLVNVPSLIRGIKNTGLLVGVHGAPDDFVEVMTSTDSNSYAVDAFVRGGIVTFILRAGP